MVLQARGQHECAQNFGTVLLQRDQRTPGHCKDGGQNAHSIALAIGQDVKKKKRAKGTKGKMFTHTCVVPSQSYVVCTICHKPHLF